MSATISILKKFDDYVAEFIQLDQSNSNLIQAFWNSLDTDLNEKSPTERSNFMQQFLQSLNTTHKRVAEKKSFVFHQ